MAENNVPDTIREGFLCPVCHRDLRSPNLLLTHFETSHSEEQDLLRSIKDLVGNVKKKILKIDDQNLEEFRSEISQKYFLSKSAPQEPGQSRSHTEYFKNIRRERLDHRTSETNKLIIRLDRLLTLWDYGTERKQHEQELVTWLDGTTVTRCPSCAASFNLTRRQHHCRLCGSIMCNSCSYFLPFDVAQTLVAPVYNADTRNREKPNKADTESLRICDHCRNMLEYRRRLQVDQMVQPLICQLYSHLRKLKSQIEPSVEQYHKMYNSLMSGETTYQLQEAQNLRSTIAKQAESLDTISKKIATLPDTPKATALQNSVRKSTSHYIKDNLLTLPALPTHTEIEQIRQERLVKQRETAPPQVKNNVKIKRVAVTTGWSPANVVESSGDSEDPLVQQINNVRNYIEQAKKANRLDEVASLKENLDFLKARYKEQLKQQFGGS